MKKTFLIITLFLFFILGAFLLTAGSEANSSENKKGTGTITIIDCESTKNCTSWSNCSAGKQQRECKNIEICAGAQDPIETIECSSPGLLSAVGSGITGAVTGAGNMKTSTWIIMLSIISVFVLSVVLRKNLVSVSRKIRKPKKCLANSILGLIDKKVYSDSGNYLGKVDDIILGKNRIDSLRIKIDKRHKFKGKGIIINYRNVQSVSEIMIIDRAVSEHLEDYKYPRKD